MQRAIFFKEWLKTRKVFFVVLALSLAMTSYAVVVMNRLIRLHGVDHLWMIVLLKGNSFVEIIKYTPLVSALAIGAAQMIPEMQQRRLKLTLHLPCPQRRIIGCMLGFGMALLMGVYLLQCLIFFVYDLTIMPMELCWRILLTTIPWFLAGLMAYLFTASVCLEGTWGRRIVLILVGIASVMVCFLQNALEAYNGMLIPLILFTILLFILPFGSVIRFKEGRQD